MRTPEESFRLTDDDTIAGVTADHRQACASSLTIAGTPISCANRYSPAEVYANAA